MEYYIETGLSGRKTYKLHEITPYNLLNLKYLRSLRLEYTR